MLAFATLFGFRSAGSGGAEPSDPQANAAQPQNPPPTANPADVGGKRVFWIIPNFRTSTFPNPYKPLTPGEKFKIATQDAFDRGTFVLAAAFAGEEQLTNSQPQFGQGLAGYGRHYGTSLANWVIGDYMTEGIFPTLLHQDPRYFEKGTGSAWSRFGYSRRQRPRSVQLLGSYRQLDGRRNLKRLPPKQPRREGQCSRLGPAAWSRCGFECAQRVLARCAA